MYHIHLDLLQRFAYMVNSLVYLDSIDKSLLVLIPVEVLLTEMFLFYFYRLGKGNYNDDEEDIELTSMGSGSKHSLARALSD